MDLTGIISLELAAGSILVAVSVFFVSLRYQVSSLSRSISDQQAHDRERDATLTSIASNLLIATKHHETVMERFASAARRGEKAIEILDRISDQLATLAKDHERVMDRLAHSSERIMDRLPSPRESD